MIKQGTVRKALLHFYVIPGWALGSLQLLGAPAGLARSLGAGLTSLVNLPYEGLAHGPAGFLFGVFHGSASLMRHVTAGKYIIRYFLLS